MSLILNGGVGGTGTTQYAYRDERIVTAIPCTVALWFKNGTSSTAGGTYANWVNKAATLGNYRIGGGGSRAVGPVLTRTIVTRTTSSTASSVGTLASYQVAVTAITSGAQTQVAVDNVGLFAAGEYVRLAGTFDGLTGITSGRDWRISSIAGNTLALEIASSGTWNEGQAATVKWSAWQPEKWNLAVLSFGLTSATNSRKVKGGFFGNTAVTIDSEYQGVTGQRPEDIFGVLDRFCIGAYAQSGSATDYFRGEIAHAAVWEYLPNASEAAELLTVAPHLVGWGAPLAYWPLVSDETDAIGQNDLQLVGSPDITSDGPSITLDPGGGGGSAFIPSAMRARILNAFGVR
jgi:hypothetical protein